MLSISVSRRLCVALALLVCVSACGGSGNEPTKNDVCAASQSFSAPSDSLPECTSANEGEQRCTTGGAGYSCNDGCWSGFWDGPCWPTTPACAIEEPPTEHDVCVESLAFFAPSDALPPCTCTNDDESVCTANGAGYRCSEGCWTGFYDGPCGLSDAGP